MTIRVTMMTMNMKRGSESGLDGTLGQGGVSESRMISPRPLDTS